MESEHVDQQDAFADELLAAGPSSENRSLRESLLRQTSAHLYRRRLMRAAGRLGVLAACFAGGMATMALLNIPPAQVVVVSTAPPPNDPAPTPAPTYQSAPERRLTPAQLELEAEQAMVKSESARRFREAGDCYLRDQDNYAAALRCYRNFLDEAESSDLVSAPNDTWLLASLKNARKKETD